MPEARNARATGNLVELNDYFRVHSAGLPDFYLIQNRPIAGGGGGQMGFTGGSPLMTKNTTRFQLVEDAQGRILGRVYGHTYKRTLTDGQILRKPPAIAISQDVVDKLAAMGVVDLIMTNRDTGVTYKTTLAHFQEAGFPLDRGYGKQVALPLYGWVTTSTITKQLEPVYIEAAKPEAEQLSLFGGYR